jgi:hypothetical protein
MNNERLRKTKNYDLFESHLNNRPLHSNPKLEASMRRVGFMPSSAIQCTRNGSDRLKVIRGHNRLYFAKKLGLPVYYVIDGSCVDLYEIETPKQTWSVADFVHSHASRGHKGSVAVIEFQKAHGYTLSAASSLLAGESAGSHNMTEALKKGEYEPVADQSHSLAVASITDCCREAGIKFATMDPFVAAVSMCVRVPDFDVEVFKDKVRLHPAMMQKRTNRYDYLAEIDALYNYGAKSRRLSLAFKARELARARARGFGRRISSEKQEPR